jgi:SAM-dependent methyltransferase
MDQPTNCSGTEPESDAHRDEVSAYINRVLSRALEEPADSMTTPPASASPESLDHHVGDMRQNVVIDELAGKARHRFLKRLVLRLARLFTHKQVAFNHATVASVQELATLIARRDDELVRVSQQLAGAQAEIVALSAGSNSHRAEMDSRLNGLHANIASNEIGLQDQLEVLERLEKDLLELRLKFFELATQRASDQTEMRIQRSRVDMLLREARRLLPEGSGPHALSSAFSREFEGDLASLYAQFEDAFRGSREEIARRQAPYLDYIYSLKGGTLPVVDIGCGRGEWLELLREHGIPAYGVDTNKPFVEWGLERALDVRLGDGLEHLEQLPQSSLGAVSAFHLAEHIELTALVQLIDDALGALAPGGLLILETPNPTNLVVGASAFYLDPTHLKPIHPHFLEFLVGSRGFVDVELRFLNPSPEPPFVVPKLDDELHAAAFQQLVDHLNWAFFGPQDCAVIGRKAESA